MDNETMAARQQTPLDQTKKKKKPKRILSNGIMYGLSQRNIIYGIANK